MTMNAFTHLHLHTQYSLLDGAIRLEHLFPRLQELGMQSVAMTDHGNMFGAVDFYTRAQKAGIKPIIGCEVYVAGDKGMQDRTSREAYHLVLLARDLGGYKNLCRLISKGYLDGFYYHPRIDKPLLRQHSQGLIALSACLSGEVAGCIRNGQIEAAYRAARSYRDIFSPDGFYLELQHNGLKEQEEVNQYVKEIAAKENIGLVATNDCHYLKQVDHRAHDILLCISTGKTFNDPNRMRHETDQLWVRSQAEMESLFADVPQALENTQRIAQICNLELELDKVYLPRYNVPEGYDLDSFLESKAWEGLNRVLTNVAAGEHGKYQERLRYELDVIKKMGFSGYFLIVWDFIAYAKSNGVPVGPGRGSGAGSLAAYSLGITALDPLPYDLLFERFLNPDRISMPDFDIDFCQDRRGDVIQYVTQKYGQEKVGQIITFGQLKPRLAIKDVGRVLGLSFAETDAISKLVPLGPKVTIDQAVRDEPRLSALMEEKPMYKEVIEIARSLEGLNRHWGTHAAGVVIAEYDLMEHVPVLVKDGNLTTQFAKDEVEKVGLVKFDFLGLKTLTVIEHAIRLIRQGGAELDIGKIPLDDKKVFDLLISGETDGIFQVESSGFKQLMKELRPDCFEDIIAAVALYRPGPLQAGMVEDYINRKHGRKAISYPHPSIESVLKNTYGVIIYQEQVMRIAVDLCGFSMAQADTLRKAMGKKKIQEMEALKEKFIQGAKEKNNMPESESRDLFQKIEKFAEYAFNKSHSAAYALISYQTAYLKAHYPVQFMAALLSSEMNNTEKLVRHLAKAREMGIGLLGPDVNLSEAPFSVHHGKILFGLGAVKGLGDSAIEAICDVRRETPFASFFDFCSRVDLRKINKRLLEVLIKSGAFDALYTCRAGLTEGLDLILNCAQVKQKERQSGQCNLLELMSSSKSRGNNEPKLPDTPEWPERERLEYEREALGLYLSGHPLDKFSKTYGKVTDCTTQKMAEAPKGDVSLAVMVTGLRERSLKNGGGRMAVLSVEDLEGAAEAVVFSKEYAQFEALLKSNEPLLLTGTVAIEGDENQMAKLRVKEVCRLIEAREKKTSLIRFLVPAEDLSVAKLHALKEIFDKYPGTCSTFLHVLLPDRGPEAILKLGNTVMCTEALEQAVDGLFNRKVTHFF